MTTILIYMLGVYLGVCWLWGLYMAVRLLTGRRLRRLLRGHSARSRMVRPLSSTDDPEAQPATIRAAEAIAESRAA